VVGDRPLTQRALHTGKALAQHMGIDLSGSYISMAQERLYRAYVAATAEKLGSESVAKGMATGGLANTCIAHRQFYRTLHAAHMAVMSHTVAVFINAKTE
tara:strand:- start:6802 stop:7101 length:300 start_codon:yes stop_codon:yes gene_type:complete